MKVSLMRRICGLLYVPDKLCGKIKLEVLEKIKNMTYFVKDECIKCKLMDCVEVCPVDCFYEGENMLIYIRKNVLIGGEPECPIDAIKPDVSYKEGDKEKWLDVNKKCSQVWPNI